MKNAQRWPTPYGTDIYETYMIHIRNMFVNICHTCVIYVDIYVNIYVPYEIYVYMHIYRCACMQHICTIADMRTYISTYMCIYACTIKSVIHDIWHIWYIYVNTICSMHVKYHICYLYCPLIRTCKCAYMRSI